MSGPGTIVELVLSANNSRPTSAPTSSTIGKHARISVFLWGAQPVACLALDLPKFQAWSLGMCCTSDLVSGATDGRSTAYRQLLTLIGSGDQRRQVLFWSQALCLCNTICISFQTHTGIARTDLVCELIENVASRLTLLTVTDQSTQTGRLFDLPPIDHHRKVMPSADIALVDGFP